MSTLSDLTVAAGIAGAAGSRLDRAGYGYLTSRLSSRYFFELAQVLGVELMVECGANAAEASIEFVNRARGRAIAIEANPRTFADITSKAAAAGIMPVCVALGDTSAEVELMVPRSGAELFSGASSTAVRNDGHTYDRYAVNQRTLDGVLDELLPKLPTAALWIDVEGRALQVLRGASQTLGSGAVALIYVEVETLQFWKDQSLAPEVDGLLRAHGFTAVIRDMQSRDQFNLIYIREDLLARADELVFCYWRDLAALRIGFFTACRLRLGAIKTRLLGDGSTGGALAIHLIAAAFGSHSSRAALGKRFGRSVRR